MKSILMIAAALAGLVSITPASASKNTGAFYRSIEYTKVGGQACDLYQNHASKWLAKMDAAKTKEARAEAGEEVNWAIEKGVHNGCAWVNYF